MKNSFQIFIFLVFLAISPNVFAQQDRAKEEQSDGMKEILVKNEIRRQRQEFLELQKRGEEALKLVEELEISLKENNSFSAADLKKLEKLEKLVRKIRSDLGGGNDDDEKNITDEETPNSALKAFNILKENVTNLAAELKKATRFTISVLAIKSTNLALRAVKFLRFGK